MRISLDARDSIPSNPGLWDAWGAPTDRSRRLPSSSSSRKRATADHHGSIGGAQIHGFPLVHPECSAVARFAAAERSLEAARSVRGVAVGGPEAGTPGRLLGMLLVMSITILMSSRGLQTDFQKIKKKQQKHMFVHV